MFIIQMDIIHFFITHLYNIHMHKNKILPFVTKCINLESIMLNKKAFLSDQCKEREGKKIEWERLEISLRNLDIPREHFMQRWA